MDTTRIIFLHHSTGECIWNGDRSNAFSTLISRFSTRLSRKFYGPPSLPALFRKHNSHSTRNYEIQKQAFPKRTPYGWKNYPFDYYNIWVKNAGNYPYMEEPTLEMLSAKYDVVIFKHCFPVSNIHDDEGSGDIDSEKKTPVNYKLQYLALRDKLRSFPATKFILFTGAARIRSQVSEPEAIRAREFFRWVIDEWATGESNIYLWDLYGLQTEGGLYFNEKYAISPVNSHPNEAFSGKLSELLFRRITDVVENNGQGTTVRGERQDS